MQHRIDALLKFIAADLTKSAIQAEKLLSSHNISKHCKREGINPTNLGSRIYKTYIEFGYQHAKGEFSIIFDK